MANSQIEAATHNEAPWAGTENGRIIDYQMAEFHALGQALLDEGNAQEGLKYFKTAFRHQYDIVRKAITTKTHPFSQAPRRRHGPTVGGGVSSPPAALEENDDVHRVWAAVK